jgi:hypothetical protein
MDQMKDIPSPSELIASLGDAVHANMVARTVGSMQAKQFHALREAGIPDNVAERITIQTTEALLNSASSIVNGIAKNAESIGKAIIDLGEYDERKKKQA